MDQFCVLNSLRKVLFHIVLSFPRKGMSALVCVCPLSLIKITWNKLTGPLIKFGMGVMALVTSLSMSCNSMSSVIPTCLSCGHLRWERHWCQHRVIARFISRLLRSIKKSVKVKVNYSWLCGNINYTLPWKHTIKGL